MRFASIAVAVIAAAMLSAGTGSANAFDRLWVFGDSTVDTGWYNVRPSGEAKFDQFLSTYNLARPRNTPPTYGMGKATSNPGPVSVEVLARLIGTTVFPADHPILPQTLPLVVNQPAPSAPDLIGQLLLGLPAIIGTNYAIGGARNHEVNPLGGDLFPNAVPTETQIDNYMSLHPVDGNALYLVSSGRQRRELRPEYPDERSRNLCDRRRRLARGRDRDTAAGRRAIHHRDQSARKLRQ